MISALLIALTFPANAIDLSSSAFGPTVHLMQLSIAGHAPEVGILSGACGHGPLGESPFRIGGMAAGSRLHEEATYNADFGFGGPTIAYAFGLTERIQLPLELMLGMGGVRDQIILSSAPSGYPSGAKVVTEEAGLLGVFGGSIDAEIALGQNVSLSLGATGFYGMGPLSAKGAGVGMGVLFGDQ